MQCCTANAIILYFFLSVRRKSKNQSSIQTLSRKWMTERAKYQLTHSRFNLAKLLSLEFSSIPHAGLCPTESLVGFKEKVSGMLILFLSDDLRSNLDFHVCMPACMPFFFATCSYISKFRENVGVHDSCNVVASHGAGLASTELR